MPMLGLVLLFATVATAAVAGPVRVEFTATLTGGAVVGAPTTLHGAYEFDGDRVLETTHDRFGLVRTRPISGFAFTGFDPLPGGDAPNLLAPLEPTSTEASTRPIPWVNYTVKALDADPVRNLVDSLDAEQARLDPNEGLVQAQLSHLQSEVSAIETVFDFLHNTGNCPQACEQASRAVAATSAQSLTMQVAAAIAILDSPNGQLTAGELTPLLDDFRQSVEDLATSLSLMPLAVLGPSLRVADEDRMADDLEGDGSAGTTRILVDLNGDGVVESHEVLTVPTGFNGFNGYVPPSAFQDELTLSFRPIGAALPEEGVPTPPQTLGDVSQATIRIHYREDSPTLQRLGFPSMGNQTGELQYTITALRVVPEPCAWHLLAAGILLANGSRRLR